MNKGLSKIKKTLIFLTIDVLAVAFSWVITFVILSMPLQTSMAETYYYFIAVTIVAVVSCLLLGLYSSIWRYASLRELIKLLAVGGILTLLNVIIALVDGKLGADWVVIFSFVLFACISGSRILYKLVTVVEGKGKIAKNKTRVIVVGGGDAGSMLIREMQSSDKLNMLPVCVLDDDESKFGQHIHGVKIAGKVSDAKKFAEEYGAERIIIAIPSASKKQISEIIKKCSNAPCKVLTIPGIYQFADGELTPNAMKEVSISDLLGREQVKVNLDEIMGYIEDKVILVTGGGGSIGSELCRQIASHRPKQLIIFDIYENNAYEIQQELLRNYKGLNLLVLIGSVRDSKKVDKVFAKYKPEIVFHAAAHKHVPLMETSPNEAVKNNVSGTFKVADAAGRNGVKRFILISTDKAVNPTNIMGATKRICEMIVQTMNKHYETDYVAVRFGNVLGSNGSVIPLFKKQIAEGGPVTITDKRIVRYFMTIPEAVSLVLQAGAYANGGEIFVLDMGNPVRIYDLALNLIKLSGYEPYNDIDIVEIGLRPGEKLYEERLMEEEGLQKTANEMISIGKPLEIDEENLFAKIKELYDESYNETDKMKQLVHELVPTYKIDTSYVQE